MSNSKVALFACTKCNSRHPFDELSQGQQLCKVSDHRRDTAHCKQCNMTLPVMCVMCICRCRGAAIEEVCKCSRRRGFYSWVTQLWSLNFYVICGLFMMFWCLALNQCMFFFLRELNWVKLSSVFVVILSISFVMVRLRMRVMTWMIGRWFRIIFRLCPVTPMWRYLTKVNHTKNQLNFNQLFK